MSNRKRQRQPKRETTKGNNNISIVLIFLKSLPTGFASAIGSVHKLLQPGSETDEHYFEGRQWKRFCARIVYNESLEATGKNPWQLRHR